MTQSAQTDVFFFYKLWRKSSFIFLHSKLLRYSGELLGNSFSKSWYVVQWEFVWVLWNVSNIFRAFVRKFVHLQSTRASAARRMMCACTQRWKVLFGANLHPEWDTINISIEIFLSYSFTWKLYEIHKLELKQQKSRSPQVQSLVFKSETEFKSRQLPFALWTFWALLDFSLK